MKKLILIITLISLFADTYAQYGTPLAYRKKQHDEMMLKGKQKSDSALYFDAYDKFSKAEYWANTEKEKIAAADRMEKAIKDIKKQKQLTDSLLIALKREKIVSDSLLEVTYKALRLAESLQEEFATIIFDKAISYHFDNWEVYKSYSPENAKKILNKIDSLDLSKNPTLAIIPLQITECENLKYLNLLGNYNINYSKSDKV